MALALLRLLIYLPYRLQIYLGTAFGEGLYWLAPAKKRIANINLKACYPELTPAARKKLLRKNFHSMGIAFFELGMAWWRSSFWLKKYCHIEGLEHLQTALKQGNGALLLSGHSTCLEIGGRLLVQHAPMQVMYRKAGNELMNTIALRARNQHFLQVILRTNMRAMIKGLAKNQPSWYAPDQDFGPQNTVFAEFMGINTATLPTTAKIAQVSGAVVLPFYPIRLEHGQGYLLKIYPALRDFPSGDVAVDARRVNQALEAQIADAPEQYLWAHRRFKTRPAGEPAFY